MIKLYLKKRKWFDLISWLISFLKWCFFKKVITMYSQFWVESNVQSQSLIKNKKLTFP